MKNIFKMLPILVLTVMVSCKKDKNKSTIAASELLNYQLVVTLKNLNTTDIRLFYFTADGDNVNGTLEGLNVKKDQTVIIKNDGFIFNETENGSITYNFNFTKDVNGNLSVKSISFKNNTDVNMSVETSYISKIPDVLPFENVQYEAAAGSNITLSFFANNTTWRYFGVTNSVGSYTKVTRGAWKGTIDGRSYMGLSIKEANRSYMLLKGTNANFGKLGAI